MRIMSGTPFAFTYADRDGTEGRIALESMRKLWVDDGCSGIVFAEPAADGSEVLHEVVIEGPEATTDMTAVMDVLLGVRSFERIEAPLRTGAPQPLVLEFRYPQPQVVALAVRA
jgi:hypothetical protein